MTSYRGVSVVVAVAALAWVVCDRGVVFAQIGQTIPPSGLQQIQAIIDEKANRSPAQQKLDSHLHLAGQVLRGAPSAAQIPSAASSFDALDFNESGNVHVDIEGTVNPALLAEIANLGGSVESAFPNYDAIRAWIPLLAVETLAARSDVKFIKPADRGIGNTRPINTKALVSHAADTVLNLGFTGSGVKVGVMSDGVNSLATLQGAGNLPPGVTVISGQAGSGDEGTAMLEIVYDLAPGAQLFFATASGGQANMANNILSLAAAGCQIIVDDFTYFAESAFQDGTIAQAVNTVTANGVVFFSSAANSGNLDSGTSGTWEGDFVAGPPIPAISSTMPTHMFNGSTNYNQVTAISSSSGTTHLKWSDPLGASCNDYDLYVMDSTLTSVISSSTRVQNCSQDPDEFVPAPPTGSRIVVILFSGATRALRLDTNRGRLAIGTAGATFGHNAAASALTVAATPGQNSIFTNGNQTPETYSSDGPRRMFYFPNGTAITPGNVLFGTGGGTTLFKTDITAADCGQGAVPGFTTFCGTSAAAPTAAAIAALIMSADPELHPTLVGGLLRKTAMSPAAGFGTQTTGNGIVMANLAVAAARNRSRRLPDFNGDGIADILWRHDGGSLVDWLMNGATVTAAGSFGTIPDDWRIDGLGRLNAGAMTDILWRQSAGSVAEWYMNGTALGGAAGLAVVSTDWQIVAVGDFNGDGTDDFVWRHTPSGTYAVWLMNGTSLVGAGILGVISPDWIIVGTADFNGDGRADILWRNVTGGLAVWFMNGTLVSGSSGALGSVTPDWQVAGLGDFNSDGRPDILWRHTSGNVAMWMLNSALGIVGAGGLGNVATVWRIIGVGDFNLDGRADILWRDNTGNLAEWLMNGLSISGSAVIGSAPAAWHVHSP